MKRLPLVAMKTLALLFLVISAATVRADNANLIQNGDFSSGTAHWDGDGRLPDTGNDVPDLKASSSILSTPVGITVKLRSRSWTIVSQEFDANGGDYVLTVKFKVSPDFKFSNLAEDYKNAPMQAGIGGLAAYDSEVGKWSIFLNDPYASGSIWAVAPGSSAAGVQTATYDVKLTSDATFKKGLYLLFPPGIGSINLLNVSVTSKTGAASH